MPVLFDSATENQGRKLPLPPPSATVRPISGNQNILNVRTVDELAVPITVNVARTGRSANPPNGPSPLVQPSDPQYANAVIVVEYGAAGAVAQVEIDVGLGVSFCVSASIVKVWALGQTGIEDNSPTILVGQPNEAKTDLQAWASYGYTPCEPPMRQLKFASVADGGGPIAAAAESALIRIPAGARRAYAVIAPAAAANVEVRFYRLFNAELVGAYLTTATNIIPPASATYCSVFNGSAADLNEARVRFELAL